MSNINKTVRVKGGNMEMCQGVYASFSGSNRGFLTREEKIEMLKEYKEDLEMEAKGVAERIKEIESKE
jgi:hypothetical protein